MSNHPTAMTYSCSCGESLTYEAFKAAGQCIQCQQRRLAREAQLKRKQDAATQAEQERMDNRPPLPNNFKDFIHDYSELCKKHKLEINNVCCCCGDLEIDESAGGEALYWNILEQLKQEYKV